MKVAPSLLESCSILDSEDLIDTAYNGLLACLEFWPEGADRSIECDIFTGYKNTKREMDVFTWMLDGVYVPGSKRNYWWGSFDIDVDQVPDRCCVWTDVLKGSSFEYTSVWKINKLPHGVVCDMKGKDAAFVFRTTYVAMPSKRKNAIPGFERPVIYVSYFTMDKFGSIYTAIDARKIRYGHNPFGIVKWDQYHGAHLGPGALCLTADQKYLWMVETQEETSIKGVIAKMKFGIEEPLVKSLFFARERPLTATGRKKPILHWVSEHKRRIKEKIEVDISKYLRGTTNMVMENVQFKITSPLKKSPQQES